MTDELKAIISIAKNAGEILKKHFGTNVRVDFKKDAFDPVTIADQESDKYIRQALTKLFPGDEILSEENDSRPSTYSKRVWMVDPLDGTKDFVGGRGAFAVMIGLLENKIPILGVVYNPITDQLFYASKGNGAFMESRGSTKKLKVSASKDLNDACLVTRNKVPDDIRPLDAQVNSLKVRCTYPEGSIGLKLGRIAEGTADIFVHTNVHGCKWDTLAPQVIIEEAGGVITDLVGKPLDYTKKSVNWDKYVIAANNSPMLDQVIDKVKLT